MANNRMYLREKITGRTFFLAKNLAGPWYTKGWNIDDLDAWFEEIHHARSEAKPFDWMWGPTTFEIIYEIAEEGSGATEL